MAQASVLVRDVAVVMRGPRPWGHLGLNAASVIVGSSSGLLVSVVTSQSGELCVVASVGCLSLVAPQP